MFERIDHWTAEDKQIVVDGLVAELETCTRRFLEAHATGYRTERDQQALAYWRARRDRVHGLITEIRAAQ